ncbi:MAG TPA: CBS domain-containing protein [Gammaproteobacteria bacterium]
MRVKELMTPLEALVTAQPQDTLARMAGMISHHNIGAVPILDGAGQLLGVVSERDIVRALALDGHDALSLTASQLMTRALQTCRTDHGTDRAREQMIKFGIRHLVVVNRRGELAGMVSQRDLMRGRPSSRLRPPRAAAPEDEVVAAG